MASVSFQSSFPFSTYLLIYPIYQAQQLTKSQQSEKKITYQMGEDLLFDRESPVPGSIQTGTAAVTLTGFRAKLELIAPTPGRCKSVLRRNCS